MVQRCLGSGGPTCPYPQFFEVEVYNSDGTPLTVDQLHVQLQRVRAQSWKTDKEPLGLLTSDHRHTWGLAYTTLMRGTLPPGEGLLVVG